MEPTKLNEFATRYTSAWCIQNAARVAAFFSPSGSLKIDDGSPAVGRTAITAAAQSFMTAFRDLVVRMERLAVDGADIRISLHFDAAEYERQLKPGVTSR